MAMNLGREKLNPLIDELNRLNGSVRPEQAANADLAKMRFDLLGRLLARIWKEVLNCFRVSARKVFGKAGLR